ncbi:hypothetical protein Q9L58_005636 [Maublancomyces gigas]|uniref:Uncharacterized protein n=1 Tax=Discina gigas TaxID=1032678 RepID=A0ABR3GHJ8_9PEZI
MKKRTVTVQINGLDKQSRTSAVHQSVSALLVAVADMLDQQPKTVVYHESDIRLGETSLRPVTIVVNLHLREQLELVKQVTALCLAAVGLCIVVGGSVLMIVGLLRGSYWAWNYWSKLEFFSSQIEFVTVRYGEQHGSCN